MEHSHIQLRAKSGLLTWIKQALAAQNVTYMRVPDPKGRNPNMYPQALCKRHSIDELSEGFPIPRTILMSAYVTSSTWKSCFMRSHSFWDSWKNCIDPFFPLLDFCGKPKPSTEFCAQLLGCARVWSRSAAQTSSYVHVSDSPSWQRVTDAAFRGWRCSALSNPTAEVNATKLYHTQTWMNLFLYNVLSFAG